MASEERMADLTLTYIGPATASGRIPVRDFAPSLLALGDLFQEANVIVNPMAPPVRLEVKTAGEAASFEASLHVATVELADLISSPVFQQAALLIGLIADASQGLFALIRWRRGKEGLQQSQLPDGRAEVKDNSGSVFIAQNSTINIADSPSVRRLTREVVRPLGEEGIDRIEISREGSDEPLEILASDEDAFEDAVNEVDPIIDQPLDAVVTVIQPAFSPRYMWRLTFGEQIIRVRITDEAFLERIQRHEVAFLEGDTLHCRLRMRQWAPEVGKPIEWTVEEVKRLDHTGGQPLALPFADQPPEEEEDEEE